MNDYDGPDSCSSKSFHQRYSIEKEIGAGGMGVVFRARDLVLNREVAIKRLKVSGVGDRAWLRFQQEAKACASLRHPNIVSIFDFGLDDEFVPYIVLDYLYGKTLAKHLEQRGVLTFTEMFEIVLPLLDGLEHAHNSQVVHRDLKPANVFLQRVEGAESGVVKIMDFGIAKVLTDNESGFETRTGEVVGSPYYISPEQLSSQKIDKRADLYSLGCTMFEMLTGRPPFLGSSALATFQMQKSETPPPVSKFIENRNVSTDVEQIVMKLLQKDPNNRFQSVGELRTALRTAQKSWSSNTRNLEEEKEVIASAGRGNIPILQNYFDQVVDTFGNKNTPLRAGHPVVIAAGVIAVVFLLYGLFEFSRDSGKRQHSTKSSDLYPPIMGGADLPKVTPQEVRASIKKSRENRDEAAISFSSISNFEDAARQLVREYRDVKALHLEGLPVNAGAFRALASMPNLKNLRLVDVNGIDRNVLSAIGSIAKLEHLEITQNGSGLPDGAFDGLADSHLVSLYLSVVLSERDLESIASAPNLDKLHLSGCKLNLKWLNILRKAKRLTKLHLSGLGMNGSELDAISGMKVIELGLVSNQITAANLARISPFEGMISIDLSSCRVGQDELKEVCRIFPNITWLSLTNNETIDDDCITVLSGLKRVDGILISASKVTDKCLPVLAKVEQLKFIAMNDTLITDKSLRTFDKIKKLIRLEIAGVNVGESQYKQLLALFQHHPGLVLVMSSTGSSVTDRELKQSASRFGCQLDFREKTYSIQQEAEGLSHFSEALGGTDLK